MATKVVMWPILAFVVMLGCFNLGKAWDKYSEVIHVAGKVVCQDCTKGYNEFINGDRPIKGCTVSLTCSDDRSRVIYYNSDVTDALGQYDMTVSKYVNGKELNEKKCLVRLVSSPDPTCNLMTDFGSGKKGVKLTQPTLVYRDTVKYVLSPFYFTTPMCDQPDSDSDSNGDNAYTGKQH